MRIEILIITIAAIFMLFMAIFLIIEVQSQKIRVIHNNMCNDLDLEYLSVTKQLIGDDFVICYNNQTKETKEIPI